MLKPCVILLILSLCAFTATAQENQASTQATTSSSSTIPTEAVHQVNPVKSTPNHSRRARNITVTIAQCAMEIMAMARGKWPFPKN